MKDSDSCSTAGAALPPGERLSQATESRGRRTVQMAKVHLQ